MNLEKNQLYFFESELLAFSSAPPTVEELQTSINSSRSTHLICTNLSSGDTLEGSFYLEKNFLVYYQEVPEILLDVSYARLQTIFRCNQKKSGSPKIFLSKNQITYEVAFDDQNDYDDWMLKLRKYCILTNFEKKYQIAEITEKREDVWECLLETRMGGNHFSARKFDKEQLNSTKESFRRMHLINEIEILRALRTKRVLNLKEVYETEDSIYLVTDCVHNLTLKKMLKASSSPFSGSKARNIMQQILKVLAEMASKKIVHRNLKPSNILMEDQKNIRIINFGLATYVNAPKANIGICGTPGYIAPEILNSHNENRIYDDKIDVFSAGCIFFEMLFGYPLFKGSKTSNKNFKYSDLIQLVMKQKNNIQPNSTKQGLDLLLKLLHNDPKQRISAEEALADHYFGSQEKTDEDSQKILSISSQNSRKRISFDILSSNSASLKGSLSEATSSPESSFRSLSPSNSLRKLSEDTSTRSISPSRFKRFSENLVLQKINFNEENDVLAEASPLLKNCPIVSPRTQKHPNQRI